MNAQSYHLPPSPLYYSDRCSETNRLYLLIFQLLRQSIASTPIGFISEVVGFEVETSAMTYEMLQQSSLNCFCVGSQGAQTVLTEQTRDQSSYHDGQWKTSRLIKL